MKISSFYVKKMEFFLPCLKCVSLFYFKLKCFCILKTKFFFLKIFEEGNIIYMYEKF